MVINRWADPFLKITERVVQSVARSRAQCIFCIPFSLVVYLGSRVVVSWTSQPRSDSCDMKMLGHRKRIHLRSMIQKKNIVRFIYERDAMVPIQAINMRVFYASWVLVLYMILVIFNNNMVSGFKALFFIDACIDVVINYITISCFFKKMWFL